MWAAKMRANSTNMLKKNGLKKINKIIHEMNKADRYNDRWEQELGAHGALREFWGKLKDQPIGNDCSKRALTLFGYKRPNSYADLTEAFNDFKSQYLEILGGEQATSYTINIEIDQLFNVVDKLQFKDLSETLDSDLADLCFNILVLKHNEKLQGRLRNYCDLVYINPDFYIEDEGYKFNVVAEFKRKFDLGADDFANMLDESLSSGDNLIQSGNYYPRKMLLQYCSYDLGRTKKAFKNLLTNDFSNIKEKVDDFAQTFQEIHKEMQQQGKIEKDIANTYVDYRLLSFLLATIYPEKCFYTKYNEYSSLMKDLEPKNIIQESGQGNKFVLFTNFAEFLKRFLEKEQLFLDVHTKLTRDSEYKDDSLSWGVWDFIYTCSRHVIDKTSWIFQGNPERFDLLAYLAEPGKKSWSVNQNRKRIGYGDRVYFWKSGENAGIYAYGYTASGPQKRAEKDPEREFGNWKVDVEVKRFLGDKFIAREQLMANEVLANSKIITNPQGTNFLLSKDEAEEIEKMIKNEAETEKIRYWQIAPGPNAQYWEDCLEGSFICVGWDELGDLANVKSKEQLERIYRKAYPADSSHKLKLGIGQLWNFLSLREGDKIIANKGKQALIGAGVVTGKYRFDESRKRYKHLIDVKWYDTYERKIPDKYLGKFGKTILELEKKEFEELTRRDKVSYYNFFLEEGFRFPKEVLTDYLLCLKTKPFVILTGISGTGKTKIAQLFAEYFAPDEVKEITRPLPLNEEGVFYYKVNKSFLKYGFTLSRDMEEVLLLPDRGESKEIKVNFNRASELARFSYVVRTDAPDCSQIRFRKGIRNWLKENLQIGDWVRIEVMQESEPEEQELELEIYLPEIKQEKLVSDRYVFISVRPDWMDCKGLLGFYNLITQEYQPTEFLKLLLRARDEYRDNSSNPKPYFVILDEMNLAKVEYYFSDFLSCLESRRIKDGEIRQEPIILHDNPSDIEFTDSEGETYIIPPKLEVPLNVFFTGTVNVDETTYMFSPKVLDRANVIEFNQVNLLDELDQSTEFSLGDGAIDETVLTDNLAGVIATRQEFEKLSEDLKKEIASLHRILESYNMHFGYRVANEIACFLNNAMQMIGNDSVNVALDLQILQKILPKFHGNKQRLEEPLLKIFQYVLNEPSSIDELKDELKNEEADWDSRLTKAKYSRSANKIYRMLKILNNQGFVSFIE